MDLFHHEVFVTALLGRLSVPGDVYGLLLDLVAVQVIEMCLAGRELREFEVVDVVDIAGVFEDRGHIACDIGLAVRDADDHRAFLTHDPDLAGSVPEHELEGVASPDADDGLRDGVDGSDVVFMVIVVYELDHDFGVGLAVEAVAVFQ